MDKLKSLIEKYGRWQPLEDFVIRIEAYASEDFSIALGNAKSLLESIAREICQEKGLGIGSAESVGGLLRMAYLALGQRSESSTNQISGALANIAQQMGNLRNEIDVQAHGKTMEEIRERNSRIDDLTKEFLIDSTELVACFLIRNFEKDGPTILSRSPGDELDYLECEEFNEFWDESFGEFTMGDYSYLASEILFNVHHQAYSTEYQAYQVVEEE